jgi:tripartite-type tricarboxylate transporter receptor subunit TctC
MMRTGIKLNHVPFTGGAPAVTALLGKHVTSYIGSTGTLSAHIKPEGGLRVLVVLDAKRIRELPEIPTCREKGYDVDRGTFSFLVAKKGTPQPILDILVKAFTQTTKDPNVQSASLKAGFDVLGLSPEDTEKNLSKISKVILLEFL